LLRFGGDTFEEFLVSLEELPDRARLAMPELEMPEITLEPRAGAASRIAARWPVPGIAPLLIGALRAMADDYGALVYMELAGIENGTERCASRFSMPISTRARRSPSGRWCNERAGRPRVLPDASA
jgi:hypothetical protein